MKDKTIDQLFKNLMYTEFDDEMNSFVCDRSKTEEIKQEIIRRIDELKQDKDKVWEYYQTALKEIKNYREKLGSLKQCKCHTRSN